MLSRDEQPMTHHSSPLHHAADVAAMRIALDCARAARLISRPNPWVGAVIVSADGHQFTGSTQAPGGAHAEVVALAAAGDAAAGSTLYCTLEPCSHTGRTGPCAQAIIDAGVRRVVIGVEDPDTRVRGAGIALLRAAGIEVAVGVCHDDVTAQLAPYLHHRRTGRPWVVLKMATTLDGRIAAVDGSSQWITGADARRRVHEMPTIHRSPPAKSMAPRLGAWYWVQLIPKRVCSHVLNGATRSKRSSTIWAKKMSFSCWSKAGRTSPVHFTIAGSSINTSFMSLPH
jgi:pyrimidine deaminase RibD-like protein